MGFLDKLTGGGVDWTLQLEPGIAAFRPGDQVRGMVTFTPRHDVDARALVVSLIATEHHRYIERTNRSGSVRSERHDASHEAVRQAAQLDGPTRFAAGQPVTRTFQTVIPPGAPPSFQSTILRCEWQVEVKLDVGGRDPSVDQAIMVVQPMEPLAAVAGPAAAARVDAAEDGIRYGISLEPAPLLLGAPFRGVGDFSAPIDTGSARVELKVNVEAGEGFGTGASFVVAGVLGTGRQNTTESITVWRGALVPTPGAEGWSRYAFQGVLPAQLVPTVDLPHGRCRASFEIIVPRRLRTDTKYAREVALATSP